MDVFSHLLGSAPDDHPPICEVRPSHISIFLALYPPALEPLQILYGTGLNYNTIESRSYPFIGSEDPALWDSGTQNLRADPLIRIIKARPRAPTFGGLSPPAPIRNG
ncbi:hypothetical protein FRC08_011587 [Ceratobasidium sp. 394]|nr:hypothetical protein FRC08_011587 [Ceratobasidium sp. 394]